MYTVIIATQGWLCNVGRARRESGGMAVADYLLRPFQTDIKPHNILLKCVTSQSVESVGLALP